MTTLGIPTLSGVSRGTHLCHFYEKADDLLSLLAPYFEAGLKNNEFCLWIAEKPPIRERRHKGDGELALRIRGTS